MNKFIKALSRIFLCPLNIHIKTGHFEYNTHEFDYCELCYKEKYNGKWNYNPY